MAAESLPSSIASRESPIVAPDGLNPPSQNYAMCSLAHILHKRSEAHWSPPQYQPSDSPRRRAAIMTTQPGTIEEVASLPLPRAATFEDDKDISQEIMLPRPAATIETLDQDAQSRRPGEVSTFSNALNAIGKNISTLPQRLIGIATFLLLWEIAPRIELVDSAFIPPPSVIFSKLGEFISSGILWKHAVASLQLSLQD